MTPERRTEPDMHGMIDELTRSHKHREPFTLERGLTKWRQHHKTQVPALVHQLIGAAPAGSTDQAGATPHSRPAARLEALDTIMLIDDEAGEWIDRLGGIIPADQFDPRTQLTLAGLGTIKRLQRVHGLHAGLDTCDRFRGRQDKTTGWCCTAHHLEDDVRRWWHQARIITGWDSPAYRPFNTCPICEHRGGLRINLEMQAGFCIECRSIWDQGHIGLLAEHIRTENAEDQTSDTPSPQSA